MASLYMCMCEACSRINCFSTPDISSFKWNENEIDLIFNQSSFCCCCCRATVSARWCNQFLNDFRFHIHRTIHTQIMTAHDKIIHLCLSLYLSLSLSLSFRNSFENIVFFPAEKNQFSIHKIVFLLEIFSEHFTWFCSQFFFQIKYEPTTAYYIPPSPVSNYLRLFSSIFKLKYDFIAWKKLMVDDICRFQNVFTSEWYYPLSISWGSRRPFGFWNYIIVNRYNERCTYFRFWAVRSRFSVLASPEK